ncbi:MAG: branched-chain amino acid ABC transporter permease [Tepidiformaceae bacterium]
MDIFFEQVADGVSKGTLYALLALALVFIFRSTDIINFAQGEMAMFSTYIGWSISRPLSFAWLPLLGIETHVNLLNWDPELFGVPVYFGREQIGDVTRLGYFIVLLSSVAIAFVFGALVERLIIRPSEGKNLLNAIIVTLGLFTIFNSVALWRYGSVPKPYPAPFQGAAIDFGLFKIIQHSFFSLCVGVALMVAIYLFFQRTKLGLAVRAAALNPQASQLMGINTGRMLTLGWGLAAAIGALAGMMVAPSIAGVSSNLMVGVLLFGFAAATLGGLDSALGAVVGGLSIGIGENLVGQYIGNEYREMAAFGLIIAVLMIKPTGLFGAPVVKKV